MSLKRIKIENFKSIVHIDIANISNFSVFAGSNGSGKSNFFEALEFIRDIIRNGTVGAIKKHNGYENIHSHKLRNTNAKRFIAELEVVLGMDTYQYEIKIEGMDKKATLLETVVKNGVEIAKRSAGNILTVQGIQQSIEYSEYETILKLVSKEVKSLLEFLSSIERYQIDPIKAREADDLFASETLDAYASNLSTVLNKLSKDKNIIEDIMDAMQMIVPGLEKVSTQKEGKTKIKNVQSSFPNYQYGELDIDKTWMSNMFDGGLPW